MWSGPRDWRGLAAPRAILLALAAALASTRLVAHAQAPAPLPSLPESARASAAEDAGDPRAELALVSDRAAARAGEAMRVGVLFQLDPGWHVYFRNPGEAALGTEVELRSEQGEVGALRWPVPERFVDPSGTITTYGYEHEVLFAAELTPRADASGEVRVDAVADFLVCRVDCIPGRVELHRSWPIEAQARPAAPEELERFARTEPSLPRTPEEAGFEVRVALDPPALRPSARARATIDVTSREACGDCPALEAPADGPASAFFPDRVPGVAVRATDVRPLPGGARIELELVASPDDPSAPQTLGGIVSLRRGSAPLALEVAAPLPRAPATDVPAATSARSADTASVTATSSAGAADDTSTPSLWAMLLLALLGGVILNAMPCVLPVLALKALGLARIAGESQRARVAHTAAYSLGILGSMWALAAIVVGLRAAGTEVGWGFQLQEPRFAAILAAVLVVLALGLFGLFEIGLDATALATRVDRAHGLRRSVGEGVLAVLLATPCSAPFLGTAVGFAFASDAPVVVAVFTAIGVGLAAPFALVALVPGTRRWLPRPGAWMRALQQLFGFFLLGAALWLVWIVGQVGGVDGMSRALVLCLVVAAATWAVASSRELGTGLRRAIVVLAIAGVGATAAALDGDVAPPARAESSAEGQWSPEAVSAALAEGRVVLVDFTAAWCITCKVNERLVLGSEPVRRALQEARAAVLVADWTERDATIRAELARHGKAGVPLYLVFSPAAPDAPEVLPELLTEATVIDAIARARGGTR